MRSIWKGAITFGMVTIPVKLYSATESKDVRFRMLCKEHQAPIEEKRVCTDGGEELAWNDLARGYEVAKGEFVVLDPEEIDAAKPDSSSTIDIGDFVEAAEIDPVYFEKSYFLEPTDIGSKPFSLLRRALDETERVALARVTIRTRERLATLRTYEDGMILETMFWPDEIRSTGALDLPEGDEARVRPKELEMARSLPYDGEVYELYLRPEFQGLGFGRRLFTAARRDLAQSGMKSVVVWALSDNEPAVDFYRALGGRPIARSSEKFGDKTLDKIAYAWAG